MIDWKKEQQLELSFFFPNENLTKYDMLFVFESFTFFFVSTLFALLCLSRNILRTNL